MAQDVYQQLAHHLDDLPAGFPAAEDGVELRILKRLFTPQQAELALHATLIPEEARVIARRANLPLAQAEPLLAEMAHKGLLFSIEWPGQPAKYMAAQYAVGIWEYQVENLDEGLVRDMNQYLPTFVDLDTWQKAPQLRTIPVGRSVDHALEVLDHESAEELVRRQSKLWVAPCICRREHRLVGQGCYRAEESCLIFGMGAYYYERRGIGRAIDVEECLEILQRADEQAMVLQPNNAKKLNNLCCCCGCCCQVLIYLKKHPAPGRVVSTPFTIAHNDEDCIGCGVCVERCQMEAFTQEDETVSVNPERCIGCGLCVSTCPTGSLSLVRRPQEEQPRVPANMMESHFRLGRARGKLSGPTLLKMSLQSRWDRFLSRG